MMRLPSVSSLRSVCFAAAFSGLPLLRQLADPVRMTTLFMVGHESIQLPNFFLIQLIFRKLQAIKKRDIPELGLDFAYFATLVGSRRRKSNLLEDYEAILTLKDQINVDM